MSDYEITSGDIKFLTDYITLMLEFEAETKSDLADIETIEAMIYSILTSKTGVSKDLRKNGKVIGLIGGIISPSPYRASKTILTEFAWFVTKKERNTFWSIRLFKAFEKAGIDAGVDYISAALRINLMTDINIQQVYQRLGYEPVEMNFLKKV